VRCSDSLIVAIPKAAHSPPQISPKRRASRSGLVLDGEQLLIHDVLSIGPGGPDPNHFLANVQVCHIRAADCPYEAVSCLHSNSDISVECQIGKVGFDPVAMDG
jgi:hypothetical protein